MNYEERYKEALDLMKDCVPDENGLVHVQPEDIFPELRESEDDRIRKGIIRNLKYLADRAEGFVKDELKERIAWLEKQGEHKPALDIEIPFGAKDSELQEATYLIPEGFHAEIKDDEVLIKKGKQKSAWSEEDENILEDTKEAVINTWCGDTQDIILDWLESLKQRIGG